jgi:hypothetical protein
MITALLLVVRSSVPVVNVESVVDIFEMWMTDNHGHSTEHIPVVVYRERDGADLRSKLLTESQADRPH